MATEKSPDYVTCPECGKDFRAPSAEKSMLDCIEATCEHCGAFLLLDKVAYWSPSSLGDT